MRVKNNKLLIDIAILFFSIGIIQIADWFLFSSQHRAIKEWPVFIAKYRSRFPDFYNVRVASLVMAFLFAIAGWIWLEQKTKGYKVLAIIAFFFGFWNLFSLM